MKQHILTGLSARYPQLLLPIADGMRDTEAYKDAVLRGNAPSGTPDFTFSAEDSLTIEQTPAGEAEVLFLAERRDFEHALRALAYRCENVEIVPSVGASTIQGLINWEKIHNHRKAYLSNGGTDWGAEFHRFTADRRNYRDTLILISAGDYSAVPASEVGIDETLWREKSICIRKYHELTHFVCRTLFPEDIDVIRDEILADLIGLRAAFGAYDAALARRFLGVRDGTVRENGRLRHYVKEDELPAAVADVERWMDEFGKKQEENQTRDVFSLLLELMGRPARKGS